MRSMGCSWIYFGMVVAVRMFHVAGAGQIHPEVEHGPAILRYVTGRHL